MGKVLLPLSFLLPTAGGVVASLAPGPPQAAMAAELNLLEQLETLNKQVGRRRGGREEGREEVREEWWAELGYISGLRDG